jgi:hypothetical protein
MWHSSDNLEIINIKNVRDQLRDQTKARQSPRLAFRDAGIRSLQHGVHDREQRESRVRARAGQIRKQAGEHTRHTFHAGHKRQKINKQKCKNRKAYRSNFDCPKASRTAEITTWLGWQSFAPASTALESVILQICTSEVSISQALQKSTYKPHQATQKDIIQPTQKA